MTKVEKISLDDARTAFKNNNYSVALELYQYFFEHALDDDSFSLYGVRLSYCLDEWSSLGKKYHPALEALEELMVDTLLELENTKDPEKFNDYISICEHLKKESLPIEKFIHYHNNDRQLANEIVRFIWPKLVDSEIWSVCSEYLPNSMHSYEVALSKCDEAMEVWSKQPEFYGDSFANQIRGWYIRDVSNILLVLKHNSRKDEISPIVERMHTDMTERNCDELTDKVIKRTSI